MNTIMPMRQSWRARNFVMLCLFVVVTASASAQTAFPEEAGAALESAEQRLQLAVADSSYPVTPGDIYELTYMQGAERVTLQAVVGSDYSLSLGVIGTVQTREGDLYASVKSRVEQMVGQAYRRGYPTLTIASVGRFQVTVTGALERTVRLPAWGLTRLSELVAASAADYTSLRTVTVRSANGSSDSYDIYRALRHGALEEDPLLRPGDIVTFVQKQIVVTVEGEVTVPGQYELTEDEGLSHLQGYFRGFLSQADTDRLRVRRAGSARTGVVQLGTPAAAVGFAFRNGDTLVVPRRPAQEPVLIVEGAVIPGPGAYADRGTEAGPAFNRIVEPFSPGETIGDLLWRVNGRLAAEADTSRIRLVRAETGDEIDLDMERVLNGESGHSRLVLEPFDQLVVPVARWYVVVSGDVPNPGSYAYAAYGTLDYYLALSGMGAAESRSRSSQLRHFDGDGASISISSAIRPGDTIHVLPAPDGVPRSGAAAAAGGVFPGDEYEQLVLVTGAVHAPGLYTAVEGRDAAYYIYRAGGADTEHSSGRSISVTTRDGSRRGRDEPVEPGDTVRVNRDGFVYNFDRLFPIITGGLAVVTATLTILDALGQ